MTARKKHLGFSLVALVALGLCAIPPAQAGRKVMPMPPIPKGTEQRKGIRASRSRPLPAGSMTLATTSRSDHESR